MELMKQNNEQEEKKVPAKEDYLRRISELSPEDQAFMDGYLFAKLTEKKKGA